MAPPALSPLSAATLIAAWVDAHQRLPRDRECVTANGLPHWTNIYRLFPGSCFSARIRAALSVLDDTQPESPTTVALKCLPCLGPGCTVIFQTTPAVRICPRCRERQRQRRDVAEDPAVLTPGDLRRYGIGMADWEEDIAWDPF